MKVSVEIMEHYHDEVLSRRNHDGPPFAGNPGLVMTRTSTQMMSSPPVPQPVPMFQYIGSSPYPYGPQVVLPSRYTYYRPSFPNGAPSTFAMMPTPSTQMAQMPLLYPVNPVFANTYQCGNFYYGPNIEIRREMPLPQPRRDEHPENQ